MNREGNTLRKFVVLSLLVLAFAFTAVAQDAPKGEFFAGYQWTNVDAGTGADRQNFNGFNLAGTGYFNQNFGITADFSGNYKTIDSTKVNLYSYMFGPTLRAPMGKATPFVHALFGGAHLSSEGLESQNAFAYALGGGLDVNATKNIAVRLGQFDYVGTRFDQTLFGKSNQNHFRYSGGIVFKF